MRYALGVLLLLSVASASYPYRELSHRLELSPNSPVELNFVFQSGGDYLRYSFRSTGGEILFDIHSHAQDGTIRVYQRGTSSNFSDVFRAPTPGIYSLYLRSPQSPTRVDLALSGTFKFLDEPDPSPSDSAGLRPIPLGVEVLLSLVLSFLLLRGRVR